MPSDSIKKSKYDSLKPPKAKRRGEASVSNLRPRKKRELDDEQNSLNSGQQAQGAKQDPAGKDKKQESRSLKSGHNSFESDKFAGETGSEAEKPFYEIRKIEKLKKKKLRDAELIEKEFWLARNGHTLTFTGLYLFSILVLFRPYELVSSLGFLSATAFYFAAITIAFYLPTQLLTEGNVTVFTTEIKAVLALVFFALVSIPIAKSPGTAWETFSDMFIKAILMFIIMVNVIRTRNRLLAMMWLSLSVGLLLSYSAVGMYWRGELNSEGYRVAVEVGGLFGNPNDLALHLVMMAPLSITLGIASKKMWLKLLYYVMTAFFFGAIMVTYSRGGFLGLLVSGAFLVWKLGRKNRFKIILVSSIVGLLFLIFAPGNYGLRILSIFIPGLDPVGSRGQRQELLWRSILVTIRNPWGIGIGNFPIVGVRNLQTHNAYTQVSSEIGILGLAAYLTLIISPFRKLAAIERMLLEKGENNWFYLLSIGFQASIIGYMVTSFFGPVAYSWFIYYLIAYAVCFRRIYKLMLDENVGHSELDSNQNGSPEPQMA